MIFMADMIIKAGAVISAAAVTAGAVISAAKWYLSQKKQAAEIVRIKEENTLICYALSACLDGLGQLGANHTVSLAKDKLDKYLNQQAHR